MHIPHAELVHELAIILANPLEHVRVEIDQVHFVDGQHQMVDAQQGHDEAVAAGLNLHPLARVHQQDGQLRGRGAGGHVAGVLLVAGGVGDDELAFLGREIAVGDIDGDALLPLRLQAVHQQGQIQFFAGGAVLDRVAAHGGELIFVDQLGVVQQPADQRAFAVVDAAAGDEAQQILALVGFQIGRDVLFDQRRGVGHGKGKAQG